MLRPDQGSKGAAKLAWARAMLAREWRQRGVDRKGTDSGPVGPGCGKRPSCRDDTASTASIVAPSGSNQNQVGFRFGLLGRTGETSNAASDRESGDSAAFFLIVVEIHPADEPAIAGW